MEIKKFGMFVVLSFALILTACVGQASPTVVQNTASPAEPTQAPATSAPETSKVATFIFTQEFDTLNPLYTNMWFSAITHQIWNCWPWDFDDENNPHPVMVTEMPSGDNGGISEDGTVITLMLRDDMTWSDGEPITSDDFKFTYEMNIDPKNAVASTHPYDLIESLETPDEHTVVITFADPFAAWMGSLFHGILPAHILRPVYEADGTIDGAEWNLEPTVGCGPFVFAEWESVSFTRFEANDNYWFGRPKLDEIFIRFVPDDASQIAALKAGDGDLGTFFSYPDVPGLEEIGIKIYKVYSGYNEGWYFYLDPEKGNPALQDVRVRQALAMAFDRFSLAKDLLLGMTVPAVTLWDNMPYVDPTLEPWPYDPEMAKQLLDEAGWVDSNGDGTRDKDGVELVLTYGTTTREVRRDTQAVVQQQLAEVGVKLDLLNFESDIFFSGYAESGPAATGQLDIFQYSTTPQFPDPDSADFLCSEIPSDETPSGTNWEGWCDEELDALFRKQATEVDFTERQQTFYEISRHIFENVYWLGVWQDPDLWGVNSKLTNVRISGGTPFFNIIEWDMTQ
ncbi:MAG: peptide ABC transporter substrate-binding protein [Chloroflexota bacterium]|nr:MAG: peptide ABC transporter substrate-binding protein [Chloroflexota bacterium]